MVVSERESLSIVKVKGRKIAVIDWLFDMLLFWDREDGGQIKKRKKKADYASLQQFIKDKTSK